jgi:hypothetical protein
MMLAFRKEGRRNLASLLALMEATIPSDTAIEAFLQAERPDAVLVTPLINFGSYQADFVKSAQALGIPVGFPVFSWDNLTNKGADTRRSRSGVCLEQPAADRGGQAARRARGPCRDHRRTTI